MSLTQSLLNLLMPSDIGLAENALARFDLSEKLFERVDRLSGGERQRVGLARLVASTADLLLVDEPLSALDPTRAQQAIRSLSDVCLERRGTLIVTLHHVEMALENFTRIVGMRDGEIAFDLPATEVTKDRLRDLYASRQDELYLAGRQDVPCRTESAGRCSLPLNGYSARQDFYRSGQGHARAVADCCCNCCLARSGPGRVQTMGSFFKRKPEADAEISGRFCAAESGTILFAAGGQRDLADRRSCHCRRFFGAGVFHSAGACLRPQPVDISNRRRDECDSKAYPSIGPVVADFSAQRPRTNLGFGAGARGGSWTNSWSSCHCADLYRNARQSV